MYFRTQAAMKLYCRCLQNSPIISADPSVHRRKHGRTDRQTYQVILAGVGLQSTVHWSLAVSPAFTTALFRKSTKLGIDISTPHVTVAYNLGVTSKLLCGKGGSCLWRSLENVCHT